MPTNTGVFPVHDNVFKIGKNGKTSSTSDMVPIAEMETFSPSIDGNVEEWTPMDTNGWKKRMKTGASMAISFTGKRCIGDEGNDYVATTAWKIGKDCESKFEWDFPDGSKLEFDCLVNVTNPGGGESTNVAPLEFDVQTNGEPTYTPAASV